jgi:hypothetical protein
MLAATLCGCWLVAGLGQDYLAPDAGDAAAEGDAEPTADATDTTPSDARQDGTTPADGPYSDAADAADGCASVQEICNDGIDNDCNGMIDCADPQCTSMGFACTAGPVAVGWAVVAFDATSRASCVSPYGPAQNVISNPMGGIACNCACSGTAASCGGTVTVFALNPLCNAGGTLGAFNIADGNCQAGSASLVTSDGYTMSATQTVTQGACNGAPQVINKPGVTVASGETCAMVGNLGGGCSGGSSCAPPVGASFSLCIAHTGNISCPAGFKHTTLVSTGNPGYVDTRGCGSCSCATNASCGVANIEFFTNANCSGSPTYVANSNCSSPSASFTAASTQVSVALTGSTTCLVQSNSMATGGVTLDSNVMTVCCP